jgi:hypothetical protein
MLGMDTIRSSASNCNELYLINDPF